MLHYCKLVRHVLKSGSHDSIKNLKYFKFLLNLFQPSCIIIQNLNKLFEVVYVYIPVDQDARARSIADQYTSLYRQVIQKLFRMFVEQLADNGLSILVGSYVPVRSIRFTLNLNKKEQASCWCICMYEGGVEGVWVPDATDGQFADVPSNMHGRER